MLFDLETHINFQLFSIGKGGDNMNKNINIRNHVCHCTEDCVTIINSYDVAESDLKPFLMELKSKKRFPLKLENVSTGNILTVIGKSQRRKMHA